MLTQGFILGLLAVIPLIIFNGLRGLWQAHREKRLTWGTYYLMAVFLIFVIVF